LALRFRRFIRWMLIAILGLGLLGLAAAFGVYRSLSSGLPDVASLRDVEMQEPMYVHAADGKLMAVFGETRRYPVDIEDVPEQLKHAFLAAEDADFYKHGGIDPKGIGRAVWLVLTKREAVSPAAARSPSRWRASSSSATSTATRARPKSAGHAHREDAEQGRDPRAVSQQEFLRQPRLRHRRRRRVLLRQVAES
jgi:membrane peptidoglycan carboxypeptidase